MVKNTLFRSNSALEDDVVAALNAVVLRAIELGASDIHFEYNDAGMRIRFRIHGILKCVGQVGLVEAKQWDEKIRAKARISTTDRRSKHDGRISLIFDGRQIGLRVSFLPTEGGGHDGAQSIVCRVLDSKSLTMTFSDLPMSDGVRKGFMQALNATEGMLLITGPTGSGKTTTLYACIKKVNSDEVKILTIEDPVEYTLEGIQQTQINRDLSFVDAMKAALRQDPDVIMVGEIRDSATAAVAVTAALTGHVVLSTLHTNSAPATLTRLLDLGIDAYTLGCALKAVSAQRLADRVCHACVDMRPVDEVTRLWLERNGEDADGFFAHADGCDECGGSGKQGRIPVMEFLLIDPTIRRSLETNSIKAIQEAANKQPQYETLLKAGVRLSRDGMVDVRKIHLFASGNFEFGVGGVE